MKLHTFFKRLLPFSPKVPQVDSRADGLVNEADFEKLIEFFLQQIQLPKKAGRIFQFIEDFQSLSLPEKIDKLPAFYLHVEQYLKASNLVAGFNILKFREEVKHSFHDLVQLKKFRVIFLEKEPQANEIIHFFFEEITLQLRPIWGENIFKKFPYLQNMNSPRRNKVHILETLENDLGFEKAAKIIDKAYEKISQHYKLLEQFPALVGLIPFQFLSDDKIELLNKNQIQSFLSSRVEMEKKYNDELQRKNKELASIQLELERNLNFTSAILSTVGEGIITINELGKIINFNKTAANIFCYSESEMDGMELTKLMPPHHRKRYEIGRKKFTETVVNNFLGQWIETKGRRKDGSFFPMELNITETLKTENNHYFTGVLKDISERKEIERKLKERREDLEKLVEERTINLKKINAELERSNVELEQFAYIASHDLQEPLRTITSFIQLLARKNKDHFDEDSTKYMDFVVSGAKRMKTLINALLSYSHVGSGELEKNAFRTEEALSTALNSLDAVIREKQVHIEIAEGLGKLYGDKNLIIQLFQNLIENGIKFCREQPRITIEQSDDEAFDIIKIQDNGIGIADEFKEKIFVIFKRLHNAEEYHGTGIGLSVCKKIMTRHSGKISLESTPGQGTSFYLHFPKQNIHI